MNLLFQAGTLHPKIINGGIMHFSYRKIYYGVGILLIVTIGTLIFLYMSKLLLPTLPFEGISKKQVFQLATASQELVFVTEHEGDNWYIYDGRSTLGVEELITRLEQSGFSYIEQMGSAYFFSHPRQPDNLIVSSQQWTSRFVLFRLPAEVSL